MNKIKSIISYAILFLGLVFVACQDVDPYGEGVANNLQLSVDQSDVSFDMERSSSVSVNASDNFGWSASTSATWVRLSPSSGVGVGNIAIGVEDNPSTEKRNAVVTLKSSRYNKTASFNVEQAGTYLRIDTTSIGYFPLSGGKRSVSVESNAAWEISSCPSWITTSVKSGNAGNTSFEMEVKENTDQSRDGVIIIKNAALSYRINVTQGGVQLELGKQTMSFTTAKGSDTFTIKSNSAWTVTSDKPSWCTVDKSSGSNNETIKVSVTDNTSESSRDAIITVKAGNISKQVKVKQEGVILKVVDDNLSFTSSAGSKTFTITTNYASWTVSSDNTSWCTVDKSSGSTTSATIKVTVKANPSSDSRSATITVKSGNAKKTVSVSQAGDQSFNATMNNTNYKADGDYWYLNVTASSGVSWTASASKTWVHFTSSKTSTYTGTGSVSSIHVYVDANPTLNTRSAVVYVKSGSVTKSISISQDAGTLTAFMGTTSYKAEGDYWFLDVTASSGISWTASASKTWVHFTSSKTSTYTGTGSVSSIHVYVDANPYTYSREADVYVKSGSTTRTITITQVGKPKAPFTITRIEIGNTDYNWNFINDYGSKIYSYQTKYLTPRIYVSVNTPGTYTIYTKLYNPNGKMVTGTSSPTGYSQKQDIKLTSTTTYINLNGWGSNTSGYYSAGQYRWEFWYNGEKIGEKYFTIY